MNFAGTTMPHILFRKSSKPSLSSIQSHILTIQSKIYSLLLLTKMLCASSSTWSEDSVSFRVNKGFIIMIFKPSAVNSSLMWLLASIDSSWIPMETMSSNFAMNFLTFKDVLVSLKEFSLNFPFMQWENSQAMSSSSASQFIGLTKIFIPHWKVCQTIKL